MDEMELLKQILESSEDVEIPESLKPENIERKLKAATASEATPKTVSFTKRITRYSEMAAAVCVLIVAGFVVNNMRNSDTLYKKSAQMEEAAEMEEVVEMEDMAEMADVSEEVPLMASSMAEDLSSKSAMSMEKGASYEEAYEDMDAVYDYEAVPETQILVMDESFSYSVTEDGRSIWISRNDTSDQVICELRLKDEKMKITELSLKEQVLDVTLSGGIKARVDVTDPAKPVFVSNKLVWE